MCIIGCARVLLAIAVAGLGLLNLVYGNFAPIWEPLPLWLPWPSLWVYASAAMLLAASVGLLFGRTACVATVVIGLYELLWVMARVRPVLLKPLLVSSWYGISEAVGPLAGTWLLCALLRGPDYPSGRPLMNREGAQHVARLLFGAACLAYGAAHFAYATYTAAMIPGWLPDHTGLAYLTGAAHVAAGLGILVGVMPRLAAILEATMMSLFGVLVWMPSFFAHPVPDWATPPQNQWSETLVTLLLAASAWLVAASLASREKRTRIIQ